MTLPTDTDPNANAASVTPDPAPTPPTAPAPVAEPAAAAPSSAAAGDASGTPEPTSEPSSQLTTPPPSYKLPEGIPAVVGEFAQKNKFTQEQLDASLRFFGKVNQANVQAQQQNLRQMGEEHLKNWGDNAQYNLQLAQRALRQNDPDGALTKILNESGYGNHPAVLNFLYELGRSMQEGGFLKSSTARPPGSKTAAQILFGDNHPSIEE